MRILIATDGSDFGEQAVRTAAERPWPANSELRVITVVEHPPIAYITAGEAALAFETVAQEAHKYAQELASGAADYLRKQGHNATFSVREGLVSDQIIEEAKAWQADLIMLGTHGRRGFTRLLLGSVAQRVAGHAPCSVEIVRMSSGKNAEGGKEKAATPAA